jgi:lysozyme
MTIAKECNMKLLSLFTGALGWMWRLFFPSAKAAAPVSPLHTSHAGVTLIKKWEGYHVALPNGECKAYLCPAGVATIGFGSTRYPDGTKVILGDVRTATQAESYLAYEITKVCDPALAKLVKVPLTQGQYDALSSFVYNCGEGAFAGSTMLKLLNKSDYVGAAEQFPVWNKGAGRVLPGLVARRAEERTMFLSGKVIDPSYPVLRLGDSGASVRNMQEMLIALDYSGVEADGVYGPVTESAVIRFQTNMLLSADGVCGPATWAILIKRTTGGKLPVDPIKPDPKDKWSGHQGNYVVATRTFKKDGAGLEVLKVAVYENGVEIGSLPATTGQPNVQYFRKGRESASGSMEPTPELKRGYKIHDIEWAGGKDNFNGAVHSDGLGPWIVWLEEDPADCRRSQICFHQDWNRNVAPGSAGCIVFYNNTDSKKFITLLRKADPRTLYVDWNLSYVALP